MPVSLRTCFRAETHSVPVLNLSLLFVEALLVDSLLLHVLLLELSHGLCVVCALDLLFSSQFLGPFGLVVWRGRKAQESEVTACERRRSEEDRRRRQSASLTLVGFQNFLKPDDSEALEVFDAQSRLTAEARSRNSKLRKFAADMGRIKGA